MSEIVVNKPSIWFWVISLALLLFGIFGISIYIAYFLETPEEFAASAETAENLEAYTDYVANFPLWALTVGVFAVITRLLGAVLLLVRRALALPVYILSLAFFTMAMFRAFALADAANAMNGYHIAIQVVFMALSIFAVWFAHKNISNGYLK